MLNLALMFKSKLYLGYNFDLIHKTLPRKFINVIYIVGENMKFSAVFDALLPIDLKGIKDDIGSLSVLPNSFLHLH